MVPRRLLGLFLALLSLGGCAIATPFRGPGYDSADGVAADRPETVVVVLTEAVLRDDRAGSSAFWDNVGKVEDSLAQQPGFIGYSLRRELLGDRAWTMTAWSDEASIAAFVHSPTHQTAIAEGLGALQATGFARIKVKRDDVPLDWERALEILAASERRYDQD